MEKNKDAIHIKPSHEGLLHKKLNVPAGKPIPASKLQAALHSKSPAERQEANFARNFGKASASHKDVEYGYKVPTEHSEDNLEGQVARPNS